jgi:hypothetical protein
MSNCSAIGHPTRSQKSRNSGTQWSSLLETLNDITRPNCYLPNLTSLH